MTDTPAHPPLPTAAPDALFEHYATAGKAYDELGKLPDGVRPAWREFVEGLQRLGRHQLASRWENGRRILREHGVTYNVYGDAQGMDRPWGLDLVPLLLRAEDWRVIEPGLSQRTRLFNAILEDIYEGGQRLLRDGFLPPELVYANPGFLRPCRGIPAVRQVYLHLHGVDLARSPNGQWWVISDRTQAPSGAGYALENRSVISRILPDELRDANVERLTSFFRIQREMLFSLAPGGREEPGVVLLTPGPHNETYFEHAYLARHLGVTLVEGADLTVRDRRVFLKTLEGLQPVDVILRRVDGAYCDPLELRADSFLGVPGLVEATRAGNVTVANPLGSGLLESPAFLAFLPGLCRHLLSEDLILPSVATWWCGQARELRYVLDHLDELIIKPAFRSPGRTPWVGGRMSSAERAHLINAIRSNPRDFVGQERVVLSRAPVWADGRFESRPVLLRTYAANGGDRIVVMPGGLTRVSRSAEDPIVSMQHGGGSKDTWVLSKGVVARSDRSPTLAEFRTRSRALSGVPSRAADNLFWLGRYTERLEQSLRVLRCFMGRLADETSDEVSTELAALAGLVANLGLLPVASEAGFRRAELQQQALQRVYRAEIPGSVPELLGRIRLIASMVRDRFSGDTWRILGRLDADARSRPGRLPLANALTLIHNLVFDLAAFNGMEMENMTRGHGWRFLDVGRRVERGLSVLSLVRAAVDVGPNPAAVLEPVLEIADSAMTYRRRYFSEARFPGVLELLICDVTNPRSLGFQLESLEQHARELPGPPPAPGLASGYLQDLKRVWGLIDAADREELARLSLSGHSAPLLQLLDECYAGLASFSDGLTSRYFSHTEARVS